MPELKANIARNVREYRKARGLTQKELSKISGVTPQTIIAIESGQQNCNSTLNVIMKLAAALGQSAEYILTHSNSNSITAKTHSTKYGNIYKMPDPVLNKLNEISFDPKKILVLQAMLGLDIQRADVERSWPEKSQKITFSQTSTGSGLEYS